MSTWWTTTSHDELLARAATAGVTARVDHADHGADVVDDVRGVGAVEPEPD